MTKKKGREVPLHSRRTSALETLMQDKRKHTHTQPNWAELPGSEANRGKYHATIERYLEYGIRPGGFLTALLSNQLIETVQHADESNVKLITNWVRFVFWELPHEVVGSKEKVQAHIEKGGYQCQE